MCEIGRHTSSRVTAEPANANHHGAVGPHACAMSPPSSCPITRPPKTPTMLTDAMRPCSSIGTRRWRTVVEIVPQTNAYMPNPNMITRATTPEVVRANDRCMSTSSDRHTRMSVENDTWRSSQPKLKMPMRPPTADARRERSVPDSAHVQVVGGVEDQDPPRRRPGHVEDEDDQHQRAHRCVVTQPVQALADRMRFHARRRLSLRESGCGRSAR